jgi:hypothetical protein
MFSMEILVKMLKAEVQMAEEKKAEWLKRPKTANSAKITKNNKKISNSYKARELSWKEHFF